MTFLPSCIQPPDEAQTTLPVLKSRSEADGGALHPPGLGLPRPQLLFQVPPMSHYARGNAAMGLVWHGTFQIAVGGTYSQFQSLRNTLLYSANVAVAMGKKV